MDFTVYTMGDMPIFVSVLNAMVAVFNSSLFDPAQGAGVYVVSILLGALFFILTFITTMKFNAIPLILAFLIFFGGVSTKVRLQVQDIYSGQIAVVANVPIIVALPSSIIATLSMAIADKVETAFTTVTGTTYLSLGAEGFANPLRTLLKLHDPVLMQKSFPLLSNSILEFVTYCAPTDPNFNPQTLHQSKNTIAYMTGLAVAGVMTYWDKNNTNGVGISCTQGQANLIRDTTFTPGVPGPMEDGLKRMLSMPTDGNYSQNPNSMSQTTQGAVDAFNEVTNKVTGLGQTSQEFMVNMVAYMPLTQGINCMSNPTGSNMSECLSGIMQREAMEKQQVDSAAAASLYARTAIPAMNILLALFYGFAPTIIGVALFSGGHALKIMAGFIMFGAWTQSWMPVAAVINYMIQLQIQYGFSGMPTSGVTMDAYNAFYTALSIKVGMASTLLAMTPVISMALLSGSVYGLTTIVNSMSSKDYVDETKAAPDVGKVDPVSHVGAHTSVNGREQDRFTNTLRNSQHNPQISVDIGSGLQANAQNGITNAKNDMHSTGASVQEAIESVKGSMSTQQYAHSATHAWEKTTGEINNVADQVGNQISEDDTLSKAQKAEAMSTLAAGKKSALSGRGGLACITL